MIYYTFWYPFLLVNSTRVTGWLVGKGTIVVFFNWIVAFINDTAAAASVTMPRSIFIHKSKKSDRNPF